jgi:hypothetical protein
MIKGIFLGICASVFIVSLAFSLSGLTGNLQENLVTGAAIGPKQLINYSILPLIFSFVAGFLLVLSFRKK